MTRREIASLIAYETLALIIIVGSAIDVFWSVVAVQHLYEVELNPLARWVIGVGDKISLPGRTDLAVENGGVGLLCGCKVLGAWFALRIANYLYKWHPRIGWASLVCVALFQIWLVCFLFFAG